jgi:hypothetical protein
MAGLDEAGLQDATGCRDELVPAPLPRAFPAAHRDALVPLEGGRPDETEIFAPMAERLTRARAAVPVEHQAGLRQRPPVAQEPQV